eukprot:2480466-Alexandrium_andersonii.AAC.1
MLQQGQLLMVVIRPQSWTALRPSAFGLPLHPLPPQGAALNNSRTCVADWSEQQRQEQEANRRVRAEWSRENM